MIKAPWSLILRRSKFLQNQNLTKSNDKSVFNISNQSFITLIFNRVERNRRLLPPGS